MPYDENEIRQALGIDDTADPVATIHALAGEVATLKAAVASDRGKAESAQLLDVQRELSELKRQRLVEQGENERRIAELESRARKDRAVAKVERLIAQGKPPRMREDLLDLAMTMPEDKFDAFVATIPTIDMRERGVATNADMLDLELTPAEITIAKQMGNWDEAHPEKSRLNLMRVKAAAKGLALPEAGE